MSRQTGIAGNCEAYEAEQRERATALAEGRWDGERCADHYEFLEPDGSCRECMDNAHERWLLSRVDAV